MLSARVYTTDIEVDQRLVQFGMRREDFYPIVKAVVAGRADATENDPLSSSGQFAYILGTRALRVVFRRKKWLLHREENIEAVKHPDKALKIVYQSVDSAAVAGHNPRAISGKGSGADRVIDSAQGKLWSDDELRRLNPATIEAIGVGIWFFCVSVSGEDVRAELSLPASLGASNFKDFIERIFIVRAGEWGGLKREAIIPGDAAEFEPVVTRK